MVDFSHNYFGFLYIRRILWRLMLPIAQLRVLCRGVIRVVCHEIFRELESVGEFVVVSRDEWSREGFPCLVSLVS